MRLGNDVCKTACDSVRYYCSDRFCCRSTCSPINWYIIVCSDNLPTVIIPNLYVTTPPRMKMIGGNNIGLDCHGFLDMYILCYNATLKQALLRNAELTGFPKRFLEQRFSEGQALQYWMNKSKVRITGLRTIIRRECNVFNPVVFVQALYWLLKGGAARYYSGPCSFFHLH